MPGTFGPGLAPDGKLRLHSPMVKKFWAFAVDFWRDGNALLGAVAAPLSIAFTLAKAFDVPALSHLRDISYAWALAPLLIWVLVAYVRLHARTAESALILQDKMRPKLKLGKLSWNSQKVGFDIEIENDSGEHLSNCLVKIEGAKVVRGKAINPAAFPMILLTRGQTSRAESGSFNLRPGETKSIGFIYRANMASGWPALDHEGGMMIFMNVRQCIFSIVALGPPSPTRIRVEVDGDEKGKMTATILDEQPTIPVTSP